MSFWRFDTLPVRHVAQRALSMIASELLPGEFPFLLTPFQHHSLLSSRRAAMIVNRVQLVAFLFAILTPLWVIVDCVFFPPSLWLYLLGLRILASAAFFAIVFLRKPSDNLRDAYRSLGILFLVSAAFYLASYIPLFSFQLGGVPGIIAVGYAFLPFVLLCCLSIFPLTALESLLIVIPILIIQVVLGILDWSAGSESWLSSFLGELWLLIILAGVSTLASVSHLALMLALVRQASHDLLTQVFTRRSGEELLELQFSIATRNNAPLSLAFIDLDHFKSVNDQFGHEVGDLVLKKAAAVITRMLRTGDILARWGGEEFIVIMPNTDIPQANIAMDRLRQMGLGQRQDGEIITPSIGIAERIRDKVEGSQRLIEIADNRMYLAKKRGRNLVVIDDTNLAKAGWEHGRA
jgi:diguanylate cyclase (GGDEF)-like protein